MFLLTINFGPADASWALLFKDEEKARGIYDNLMQTSTDHVYLSDDFGQDATIALDSIHGLMLEDLEKSKLAQIERGLHQARVQAKAQQMAGSDPLLKAMAMTRGPAMIDPMGNGRLS
jgi:hypothetical protein